MDQDKTGAQALATLPGWIALLAYNVIVELAFRYGLPVGSNVVRVFVNKVGNSRVFRFVVLREGREVVEKLTEEQSERLFLELVRKSEAGDVAAQRELRELRSAGLGSPSPPGSIGGKLDDVGRNPTGQSRAKASRTGQSPRGVAPNKGKLPDWLKKRFAEGEAFNKANRHRYKFNEVEVTIDGKKFRVDSYNPGKEIVSRRLTQFSDIQEKTAVGYFNEFTRKYSAGTEITSSPFNPKVLRGDRLRGRAIARRQYFFGASFA